MTKPPAGSSLLFGALADSGRIKQRENGSYRMVLKGIDEIDWFTDRPDRVEGIWKPQKLISQWESFFETSEPNAQVSFKVGEERELVTFEMFKPKYNKKKQKFSFKIDAEIINDRERDLVTGLKGKALDEVTLFIDDASTSPAISCDLFEAGLSGAGLSEADLSGADLSRADLSQANLSDALLERGKLTGTNLIGASLHRANLRYANLYRANLSYADLVYTDLSYTILAEANLVGALLTSADLTGAIWENTTCPNGTLNSGTSPCTAEQLNLA